MKSRFFVWIFCGLLCCNLSESQAESDKKFTYGVSSTVYTVTYDAIEKDVSGDYSAIRLLPFFNYRTDNVETKLVLEIDQLFGAQEGGSKLSEDVGVGADKRIIEIRNLWLRADIEQVEGLSLKTGIATYSFPLVIGDHVPMVSIGYKMGWGTINFAYLKIFEGELNEDKDDSQVYVLDATYKTEKLKIRPAAFLYQVGEKTSLDADAGYYKDDVGILPAVTASVNMGTVSIDVAGAFAVAGKNKNTDVKYSGYAFDLDTRIRLRDNLKVGGFASYISGDKPDTADEDESYLRSTISGDNSGINLWRLYIFEDAGSFTTNSDVANALKYSNAAGYIGVGPIVDASFGKLSGTFLAAYLTAAEDYSANASDKDMGIEIDLQLKYKIAETASLFAEFAYLNTGDFYKQNVSDIQNAMYAMFGMKVSL